ncbi:hypothetical protein [Effusibacillus pohliae]|uniref:hypothetical protein n=1 Tax=Effusibacillus pohliae TaxID=232270 RepID=UPI00036671BC|nr:hypothetical protein [Effusibacillus pohliae]
MPDYTHPLPLLQQIISIRDLNASIVERIKQTRRRVEALEPAVGHYLKGRERVFNSFVQAAQKIADAFLQSGFLLVFQLKFEVERLTYLTFRGIGQFSEFLLLLVREDPVVKRTPVVLQEMIELQRDMAQLRESLPVDRFCWCAVDAIDVEPCVVTGDGIRIG